MLGAVERHTIFNRPYPPSLFKKSGGEYCIETKESIMWGQMQESLAINQYMKATGNTVQNIFLYCLKLSRLHLYVYEIISRNFQSRSL